MPVDLSAVAADLTAKLAKATPGPWGVDRDRTGGYDLVDEDGQFIADRLGAMDEDNARFIVAAVNAARPLLAERAALLAEVQRLREKVAAVEALADDFDAIGNWREWGVGNHIRTALGTAR